MRIATTGAVRTFFALVAVILLGAVIAACGMAASALGIATEGRTAMAELGGEPQA